MSDIATGILIGAVVYALSTRLHGLRWILAIPLIGGGYMAFDPALAWPSMVALKADMGEPAQSVVGILCLTAIGATLYLVSLFLPPKEKRTHT